MFARTPHAILLLLVLLIPVRAQAQGPVLAREDSVRIPDANIWGVLAETAGDDLALTTARAQHIFFRRITPSLADLGTPVEVALPYDALSPIADHKTIYWKGAYYLSFSTSGDRELYVAKLDAEGQLVGDIVTVVRDSPEPTNDMILAANEKYLYIGHYLPPSQHRIYTFDEALNRVGDTEPTDVSQWHNNIGGVVWQDDLFHLFTGNQFGPSASLIVTRWDGQWRAVDGFSHTLLAPSSPEEGYWFGTGAAYDSVHALWYVAFQHKWASDTRDEEHVDLAVFTDVFDLVEHVHVSPQRTYRPHLLLHEGRLFLSYDAGGGGVFVHRYAIDATAVGPRRPAAVELDAPARDAVVSGTDVTLRWRAAENATHYHVQMRFDEAEGGVVYNDSLISDTTVVVRVPQGGAAYGWRVRATNELGWGAWSEQGRFVVASGVGHEDGVRLPGAFRLLANHPNPFHASTNLSFEVDEVGDVTLVVYDLLGRPVRQLAAAPFAPGRHTITWDGRDASGQRVASGMYLYRLAMDGRTQSRTMTLLK